MADSAQLVGQYIEEDPGRPGPANARLVGYGVNVWALISYYQQAVNRDESRAATDFDLPLDVVVATIEYYRQHKDAIDARITLNADTAA